MPESIVATRYARAMIELGAKQNLVDTFVTEFSKVTALVSDPDTLLLNTLSHPGFPPEERKLALNAVLEHVKLHPYVGNLLRVMLEKGRFALLPDVISAFDLLADEHAGRMRARVTTAAPMDKAMAAQVIAALQTATGRTVVVDAKVDPDIIGGVVAEVDGRIFDSSLRTRLEQLRQSLVRGDAAHSS